jgi:hypothetical protein
MNEVNVTTELHTLGNRGLCFQKELLTAYANQLFKFCTSYFFINMGIIFHATYFCLPKMVCNLKMRTRDSQYNQMLRYTLIPLDQLLRSQYFTAANLSSFYWLYKKQRELLYLLDRKTEKTEHTTK